MIDTTQLSFTRVTTATDASGRRHNLPHGHRRRRRRSESEHALETEEARAERCASERRSKHVCVCVYARSRRDVIILVGVCIIIGFTRAGLTNHHRRHREHESGVVVWWVVQLTLLLLLLLPCFSCTSACSCVRTSSFYKREPEHAALF